MTVLDPPATESGSPPDPGPEPTDAGRRLPAIAPIVRRGGRWVVVLGSTLVIFAAFLVAKGADVMDVYRSMWDTAVGSSDSLGETFLRATPILLAALATAVPAKAGLFNLGGEGQLLLGAVGAFVFADMLGGTSNTIVTLTWMVIGGAVFGAGWALLAGLLKVYARTNEAIASLLLNYIAGLIITWLCFEPWKDPTSLGQAYSRELEGPERFPIVWGNRVHAGIFVALAVAFILFVVLRYSTWGFKLRVLGGNPSAARRAGLAVGGLSLGAMALGGALAGIGGMVEVAGTEGRLRPELLAGVGFIGFLASWLARHDPLKIIGSAVLLGGIAVGGSGLKITAGLSGGAVNILMALVLFAVLGWGPSTKKAGTT